jgi:hypothetical protein
VREINAAGAARRALQNIYELPADGTVRELFADREALTREMSDLVSRNVQAA